MSAGEELVATPCLHGLEVFASPQAMAWAIHRMKKASQRFHLEHTMDAANDCARARTLMFACFVSDFESDDPRMASQAFEEFRRSLVLVA